ncbi:unnamed protein product, partial [Coregonus sp. 'balchen']
MNAFTQAATGNVWKLCEHIKTQTQIPLNEVYAVFISNERRMIPMWKHKSSRGDEPVVWILSYLSPVPSMFTLQKPSRPIRVLNQLSGDTYLKNFASDRSHMKDANGTWLMPPTLYHCIETGCLCDNIRIVYLTEEWVSILPDSKMNLDNLISMDYSGMWT